MSAGGLELACRCDKLTGALGPQELVFKTYGD
jgi:hypothetical protein